MKEKYNIRYNEFIANLVDYKITHEIDIFLKYLDNIQRIEDFFFYQIYISDENYINEALANKFFKEKNSLINLNLKKEDLIDFFHLYYKNKLDYIKESMYIDNYSLYSESYGDNYYDEDYNEYGIERMVNEKTNKDFQDFFKSNFLNPLISHLLPLSKFSSKKITFDLESYIQSFYQEIISNTIKNVKIDIQEYLYFNCNQLNNQYINKITEEYTIIELWLNTFKQEITNKRHFVQGYEKNFIPLLHKSGIHYLFHGDSYERTLTKAISQYLVDKTLSIIIVATLRSSQFDVKTNRNIKNLRYQDRIDLLSQLCILPKASLKYLLFYYIELFCNATEPELKYIMKKFHENMSYNKYLEYKQTYIELDVDIEAPILNIPYIDIKDTIFGI